MSPRVKTCVVCDKKREEEEEIPEHVCFKNWSQSSQAMEADVIVEGFRKSLEDHGLIYKYLIGDADSSVFSKIQMQIVYPGRTPVEKVDCVNHGVRGLNSKLFAITNNTAFDKQDRDTIIACINRYFVAIH
jgi:hypothetical protein